MPATAGSRGNASPIRWTRARRRQSKQLAADHQAGMHVNAGHLTRAEPDDPDVHLGGPPVRERVASRGRRSIAAGAVMATLWTGGRAETIPAAPPASARPAR